MATLGTAPITTRLVLSTAGQDYDIGDLAMDVPVHVDHDDPTKVKVGDLKPAIAAALREAADVLDGESAADTVDVVNKGPADITSYAAWAEKNHLARMRRDATP